MSEKLPKALDRYKILKEVGRGATAFVYKAYDPQLDRYLALKVLKEELAEDKDSAMHF
jgi:serine/threonine-protein kinase